MSILKRAQEKTPTNVSNKLSPDLQLQFLPSEPNPFKGLGRRMSIRKCDENCQARKTVAKDNAAQARKKKKEDAAKAKKKKVDDAKILIAKLDAKQAQEKTLIDNIKGKFTGASPKGKFTGASPKLLEIIFKRHAQDTKAILDMFFRGDGPHVPVKNENALQDIIDLLNLVKKKKENGINPALKVAKALEEDTSLNADEKFKYVQKAIKEMKHDAAKAKKKKKNKLI